MRAISVKQPWAYLLCAGINNIENRTWKLPERYKGKRVLIHASGKPDKEPYMLFNDAQIDAIGENIMDVVASYHTTSAIIGSVVFADCVINHPSVWGEQSYGYSQNRSCWPDGIPSTAGSSKAPYIVELEKGVYLSDGNGDPARTLFRRSALRFRTKTDAEVAILRATKERAFERPQVIRDGAIFNWVVSDPILFDKPILNIKGMLGFWGYDGKINK